MSWLAAAAVAVPVVVTKGILTVRSRGRKDSSDSDRCAYHWQQVPSSSDGSRRLLYLAIASALHNEPILDCA